MYLWTWHAFYVKYLTPDLNARLRRMIKCRPWQNSGRVAWRLMKLVAALCVVTWRAVESNTVKGTLRLQNFIWNRDTPHPSQEIDGESEANNSAYIYIYIYICAQIWFWLLGSSMRWKEWAHGPSRMSTPGKPIYEKGIWFVVQASTAVAD